MSLSVHQCQHQERPQLYVNLWKHHDIPTARLPIASNGKLVDVIECTPTRLRPQRQPTQNVAIQEKGKFPIFLFPLIAFQIDLLEVSKQVDPLLI